MTITVPQSPTFATAASATSLACSYTATTIGNLLVISWASDNTIGSTPAGWSTLGASWNSGAACQVYGRIATSADTAGTSVTLSQSPTAGGTAVLFECASTNGFPAIGSVLSTSAVATALTYNTTPANGAAVTPTAGLSVIMLAFAAIDTASGDTAHQYSAVAGGFSGFVNILSTGTGRATDTGAGFNIVTSTTGSYTPTWRLAANSETLCSTTTLVLVESAAAAVGLPDLIMAPMRGH